MHTARPLLLDLTEGGALAGEAAPWRDRVDVTTGRVATGADARAATATDAPTAASTPTALLLRPDCYVAWASESARPDKPQRQALRTALTHWFGSPLAEGAD
jgi:hypothetical protein